MTAALCTLCQANMSVLGLQERAVLDPDTASRSCRDASAPDQLVVSDSAGGSSRVFRADRNICRAPDPESAVQAAQM